MAGFVINDLHFALDDIIDPNELLALPKDSAIKHKHLHNAVIEYVKPIQIPQR